MAILLENIFNEFQYPSKVASNKDWDLSGSSSVKLPGGTIIGSNVAPAAGGSASAAILATSTALLGIYFGTGTPSFSAAKGSLYVKVDASTNVTRLWVATDDAGTWTFLTTNA